MEMTNGILHNYVINAFTSSSLKDGIGLVNIRVKINKYMIPTPNQIRPMVIAIWSRLVHNHKDNNTPIAGNIPYLRMVIAVNDLRL